VYPCVSMSYLTVYPTAPLLCCIDMYPRCIDVYRCVSCATAAGELGGWGHSKGDVCRALVFNCIHGVSARVSNICIRPSVSQCIAVYSHWSDTGGGRVSCQCICVVSRTYPERIPHVSWKCIRLLSIQRIYAYPSSIQSRGEYPDTISSDTFDTC
jgi:hypothetical protein